MIKSSGNFKWPSFAGGWSAVVVGRGDMFPECTTLTASPKHKQSKERLHNSTSFLAPLDHQHIN